MSAGILCANQVYKLIETGHETIRLYKLSGHPFDKSLVGASAIDLPLGNLYWEMEGSCRTGSEYKVPDLTKKYCRHHEEPKSLGTDSVLLKKHNVYLFEADCELDLTNRRIQGKATARSSARGRTGSPAARR